MYKSHWGLNARPFDHRADGAFYYPAQGHQAALALDLPERTRRLVHAAVEREAKTLAALAKVAVD